MITEINRSSLSTVRNPSLASYAERYVQIYENFMDQVRQTGIEIDSNDYTQETREKVSRLQEKGVTVRNDAKSLYLNRISPACIACQTGIGSATFFVSLKCHRSCYYCFNPNQEDYEYFTAHQRNLVEELEQVAARRQKVKHLALTGGEPLLFKPESVDFFQAASQYFPTAYSRLYTCGDYVDAGILQQLKDSGLQEIRFSIRMHDLEKNHRHVFDRIALAKAYIPYVMVEMPVLPDTDAIMQEVLLELDRLDVFSINLLEFCFPFANVEIFNQKGFKVKTPPYRILYNYWYAGGLPIARSELLCLDLLDFAAERQLQMGIHYCSLENKHTGQIYQQNFSAPKTKVSYFSEKDYFLKTAKVFGEDIEPVRRQFLRKNFRDFTVDPTYNYLEFPLSKVRALAKLDVEIGVSSGVMENRGGEQYLRELKIDLAKPVEFDFATDV